MINEGDYIRLTIIAESKSPNGTSVFIAKHKNRKFILSKSLFKEDIPMLKQSISCFVDKINCSGHIYLIPISERKLVEKVLLFKLIKQEPVFDSLNQKKFHYYLIHNDELKANYLCYNKIQANELNCKIAGFKKSKPIIEPQEFPAIYKYNTIINVKIKEIKNVDTLGDCYIVEDKEGRIHPISVEKFAHYQLQIDSEIKCQILGADKKHNLKLEPLNPKYEIGKVYQFKTLKLKDTSDDAGNRFKVLILQDDLGKEASIVQLSLNYKIKPRVKARVYRINNGRLYLSLVK